ncbi:MAG: hypothetical protein ACLGIN_11335 [Candidatus Sericytochromatia bacterium]
MNHLLHPSSRPFLSAEVLARVLAVHSVFPPFHHMLETHYARTIRCFVEDGAERTALLHLGRLVGEHEAAALVERLSMALVARMADLFSDPAFEALYEADRYYVLLDQLRDLLTEDEAVAALAARSRLLQNAPTFATMGAPPCRRK